jgi:protein phosphatase
MALRIVEKASLTDVGRQRQSNEDAFFERSPLFAVADGMGGARAGEVASRMAVEELATMDDSGSRAEERLREIARGANRRIYEMAQGDSEHAGMGTTFTAVLVTGREVAVGHVGDSRLYRMRGGQLERLTNDHSLVEELVRQGKLTPQEAEVHPQRSIITRALGPESDVQVDTFTHTAQDGDVYLLCSDGLSGMVSDDGMRQILAEASSLDDAARGLIDSANANGGKDNITAVLFRVADDEGAEEEADTPPEGMAAVVPEDQPTEAGTMALGAEEAERARAAAASAPTRERPLPSSRAGPADPTGTLPPRDGPAPSRPRRPRPKLGGGTALALVLLAAVLIGLYAASRQVYFLGTDERGAVSLFRGVPYELPLGIDLYTHEYSSSVPVSAIGDSRQRSALLDHEWRGRDDAERRIRELERTETPR